MLTECDLSGSGLSLFVLDLVRTFSDESLSIKRWQLTFSIRVNEEYMLNSCHSHN